MQRRDALDEIRHQGHKLTPQRRAVVQALQAAGHPLTAQEVFHHVRQSFPEVSLDTVYRNLRLLTDLGILHLIGGRDSDRFELAAGTEHHHHLVCLNCGGSVCIDFCPLDQRWHDAAARHDFQITRHSFDIYGYCNACRNQ